jgi:S-adenosylmethionine-diacylglycerol 3-amino-3-carboxypropyl transferase
MNLYIDHVAHARGAISALLDAPTLEDQREIYTRDVRPRVWTPLVRWLASRDATLALLAVPRLQREHLEQDYRAGIADFIEERLEEVFTRVAIADNYFWRVYLTGRYTPACCPEYLKPHNFERLQRGLVDRIHTHTASLLDFLGAHEAPVSRFVLLDHMDWLGDASSPVLAAQWDQILRVASPGARVLWRSGGRHTEFVDRLTVSIDGRRARLGTCLAYAHGLAASLHARDRVRTYGSFHIADLVAG